MPPEQRAQLAVFLREIKDDPDDDTPRLVLADWLQDQGDPRGEFLAMDLEYGRLPAGPRRDDLYRRRQLLLNQYIYRWVGPLMDRLGTWSFERGFIHLQGRAAYYLTDDVERLLESDAFDWVMKVTMTDLRPPWVARLADSPLLEAVPCLGLANNRLTDDELPRFLWSLNLSGLRSLDLGDNRLGPRGAEEIAECNFLRELHHLRLAGNRLGDAGALSLAGARWLGALRSLDVARNQMTLDGLLPLVGRFGDRLSG